MNLAQAGRDSYGGCRTLEFGATGFFRLEQTGERWWLVTPDGHAYLSMGLNHVGRGHLLQDCNRSFWAKAFGLAGDADDEAFQPGFEQKVMKDMEAFGVTTLGTHSNAQTLSELPVNDVVDVRMVDVCHYQTPGADNFMDVFSDDFVRHCEARARELVAPRKDDRRVLGYTLTDCPILTEAESWPHVYNIYGWERQQVPSWPRVLRNLPDSSGKRAYVKTMRQIYRNDIAAFNATYQSTFTSFEDLGQTGQWRRRTDLDNKRETRDNAQFLLEIIDKCFEVEVAAIRKFDSNHLIFGDKFQGNRMGLDVPDEHIALFAKHFELIFFQKYALWPDLEDLLEQFRRCGGGKPVYMGDSSVNVPNPNMPDPFGPQCANQDMRAEAFLELFENCFSRPDFVGWDWCGWMDLWVTDPDDLQAHDPRHAGLQDPFGNYNQPIQKAMKAFSERLYDVASRAS